ncbi:MAG: hypothetical protein ACLSCV_08915 [Acutalibacteraceae bacterium]
MTKLALELSAEANARHAAAERILSELAEEDAQNTIEKKLKCRTSFLLYGQRTMLR